jgi:hypothetical protein
MIPRAIVRMLKLGEIIAKKIVMNWEIIVNYAIEMETNVFSA